MTNQEIINYVTESPNNTNPAILNQMLNSRDISWNDLKDKPFYVKEKTITLFENIVAVDNGNDEWISFLHTQEVIPVDGDRMAVVWNNTKYDLVLVYYPEDDEFFVESEDGAVFIGAYSTTDENNELVWSWDLITKEPGIASLYVTRETVHKLDVKYLPDEWDLIIENITNVNEIDISVADIRPVPQEKIDRLLQKMVRGEPVKIVYRKMPTKGEFYLYKEFPMQIVEGQFNGTSIVSGYAYVTIPNFVEGWIEPIHTKWICVSFRPDGIGIYGGKISG